MKLKNTPGNIRGIADPGHVTYQSRVLYASLDDYGSPATLAFQGL